MASTTFSYGTIIASTWLNDVNNGIYNTLPLKAGLVSPSFTTPTLGVATATSINKVTITQPATGATLTIPDGTVATVSGTNTGDQLVFKTISVSGQSDVVADTSTDTLTLAAGLGMTITTNSATDTVTFASATSSIVRSARTSNTILGPADSGTFIDITSGTFTQTFTAAATLTSGWYCYVRNSGTGDITLDPNGAELIDGLTSYKMYPNETRLIQCTGTAFTSIVLTPYLKSFTASATWTKPPGYSAHGGFIWSAGGSGQKSGGSGTLGIGGCGGGCFPFRLPSASYGATEVVTVGAGGVAQTSTAAGNQGGYSSMGIGGGTNDIRVAGGFGGSNVAGGQIGGAVRINTTTNVAFNSNSVTANGFEAGLANGVSPANTVWGGAANCVDGFTNAGSSIYGGGAGACVDTSNIVHNPGGSFLGGNGGSASTNTSGTAGSAKGGGGGATQTGTGSGAGGDGQIDIGGYLG
jgi:hypothetical protein